ncbi:MAG: tRNA-dihydrouridine synthase [Candidatus Taylorbacteria bacterium]|nr:tRNA-dihydrouridine synthase [Candidatus Taylorbacteria bacterium]
MWTEFVSADGLVSVGRKNLLTDLKYSSKERPIIAQLFTGHQEAMLKASKLIAELGFDGLDINMGCPDRAVEKQGGGSAMIKNPNMAIAVLNAAREGVGNNIPISIKTRIGYNKVDLDWIKLLLEQKIPALTVHLRTRKEMSDVPAHWELMPEIISLRNMISPSTLIIGNGDVESMEDARAKVNKYGCDGIMIGRGIFGKPWFFEKKSRVRTPEERLKILVEHAKLFEKTFGGRKRLKNFAVMRKHFKAYVNGWDGAKELRAKLMKTETAREVELVVKRYIKAVLK